MSDLKRLSYDNLDETVFFTKLSNGLRLTLVPKAGFKEVYGMMTCQFGSIDNHLTVANQTIEFPLGVAHFLEHQLFEKNEQEDMAQQFSKLGSDSNAFTSFEKTHYYFSGTNNLLASLGLLQTLVSKQGFTDMSINKEKEIIKKEIALYQDDPDSRLYQGVLENLYPQTALAEDIVGTDESIVNISLTNLKDCFSFFYQPSNLHFVVVGDFDVKEVFNSIQSFQSNWPKKEQFAFEKTPLVLHPVIKKRSIMMPIATSKLGIGIRRNNLNQDFSMTEKIKIDLFFSLLLGWTSQDYQKWYDKGMIDDSFTIETTLSSRYQFVVILLDTKHPITMSSHIKKKLKQVASHSNFSLEQFEMLKKERYGDFMRELDSLEDLTHQLSESDDNDYFDFPQILMSFTLDEVIEAGQAFLKQSDLTEFMIFPK
ncbi:EF-P 5-aminopentanol modification-associated protein YfmH [Streptococcus pacificus]|uniref:Insulinase family protein n=1 Tax=Streptococcus pacificus TaxID=2740577 RepID=A0ABS0ZJZ0_9STRE|nr:pitrilysin family protein [Streptococcus pacificus]MBJ8326329.1 insulinase family protein [Streptococcus pacificus]